MIVPTGNFEDGMIWDSANIIKVNAAPYIQKFGTKLHCGVMVTSHHLQPVYQNGDILLISKRPPREGDTYIFINRRAAAPICGNSGMAVPPGWSLSTNTG